jgi:hypothetical protein
MTNPYARLLALLPTRPLLVGEVIDVVGGVATIEMPGGGRDFARGEAVVGQRVFFRDGNIEGAAPVLPVELISV